jgi:hypothetical protein
VQKRGSLHGSVPVKRILVRGELCAFKKSEATRPLGSVLRLVGSCGPLELRALGAVGLGSCGPWELRGLGSCGPWELRGLGSCGPWELRGLCARS